MSPENQWLEDVFLIEIVPFLGDMLVFGGVVIIYFLVIVEYNNYNGLIYIYMDTLYFQ